MATSMFDLIIHTYGLTRTVAASKTLAGAQHPFLRLFNAKIQAAIGRATCGTKAPPDAVGPRDPGFGVSPVILKRSCS